MQKRKVAVNISSVNRNIGATRPRNSTVQLPRFFFLSFWWNCRFFCNITTLVVVGYSLSPIPLPYIQQKIYISILFILYILYLYGRGIGFHILVAVERVSPLFLLLLVWKKEEGGGIRSSGRHFRREAAADKMHTTDPSNILARVPPFLYYQQ